MQKLTRTLLASLFLFAAPATMAHANEPPAVMASIKPVHSLVVGVMQGVGTPGLIVDGAASPHDYALKPSQAKARATANSKEADEESPAPSGTSQTVTPSHPVSE